MSIENLSEDVAIELERLRNQNRILALEVVAMRASLTSSGDAAVVTPCEASSVWAAGSAPKSWRMRASAKPTR